MMKAIALMSAMTFGLSALSSAAVPEVDALRRRCAEQERQITQLEAEVTQLKALLEKRETGSYGTANQLIAHTGGHPTDTDKTVYRVKKGDNLAAIARRHGVDPTALAKANNITNPSLIRIGQELRLPGRSTSAPAGNASSTEVHTIAAGDTLYGISRRYGLTVDELRSANPEIQVANLRIGQKIRLPRAASAQAPEAPTPTAAELAATAPEDGKTGVEESELPAGGVRSISIDQEMTLSDFASKHGTTPEKLNALNGLSLPASTVLAAGSELYVPKI